MKSRRSNHRGRGRIALALLILFPLILAVLCGFVPRLPSPFAQPAPGVPTAPCWKNAEQTRAYIRAHPNAPGNPMLDKFQVEMLEVFSGRPLGAQERAK